METINITKQNKSYEQINSLVITLAGLATALEYRNKGEARYNPGDYIIVEGKSTNKMIGFPLVGPVEAALKNRRLETIQITIENLSPSPNKYEKTVDVLKRTMDYIFSPILLDFYERYLCQAEQKFGKYKSTPDTWPDSWQFAWVVRNAIAHNYKIHFDKKDPKPKSWFGITISKEHQGVPLKNLFNFADLIVLLFAMERDLD